MNKIRSKSKMDDEEQIANSILTFKATTPNVNVRVTDNSLITNEGKT